LIIIKILLTRGYVVIIAGHSECGGVSASLKAVQSGGSPDRTIPEYPASYPLNRWLAPLTEFIATLDISSLPFEEALPIAVEANVKRQVEHLSGAVEITNAKKEVWVHGWVYDLATGRLRDLEISRPAVAAV
jgi:carbonic anhydrase